MKILVTTFDYMPGIGGVAKCAHEMAKALADAPETVTDRDRLGPTVTDRDRFQLNELNEEESLHSFNSDPPASKSQPEPSADFRQIAEALKTLPDLPSEVWDRDRSPKGVLDRLSAWYLEHKLGERFCERAPDVGALLLGLVLTCRRQKNPQAYFFRARASPAEYLLQVGRQALLRFTQPRNEPADARKMTSPCHNRPKEGMEGVGAASDAFVRKVKEG